MQPPSTSPFSRTDFHVFGPHSKRGSHMGIRTKDGQILINFNDGTSHAMLKSIASAIKAEMIVIKGTWTFTPDVIEDDPDDSED